MAAPSPGDFYEDLRYRQQKMLYKLCQDDQNQDEFNKVAQSALSFNGSLDGLWIYVKNVDPPKESAAAQQDKNDKIMQTLNALNDELKRMRASREAVKRSSVSLKFDEDGPIISRINSNPNTRDTSFSFRNMIRHKSDCLISSYITNNNLQISEQLIIPNPIKQLCFDYFIGNFPSSIYDDKLSKLNEKAKYELIQISLNILCPGHSNNNTYTQHSKLSLLHLIDLTQFCLPNQDELSLNITNQDNMIYFRNIYLSTLLSSTEIAQFYNILNKRYILKSNKSDRIFCPKDLRTVYVDATNQTVEHLRYKYQQYGEIESIDIIGAVNTGKKFGFITFKSREATNTFNNDIQCNYNIDIRKKNKRIINNYNELIIQILCKIANNISVQLLYQLLSQNHNFYQLYKNELSQNACSYKSFTWFIKQDIFEINTLRKLLYPLIFEENTTDEGIDSLLSLSLVMLEHKCPKITWLWLLRELQHIISDNDGNIYLKKTFLERILKEIWLKMQTISFGKIGNDDTVTFAVFDILFLLIETVKLDISFKITNYLYIENIITNLLRFDKYGIIGWKILNMEMDKIIIMHNTYKYYNEWISYIEKKTGLFKMNIISNIDILKHKKDGNIVDAQNELKYSITVCHKIYKIHKLSYDKLVKFSSFYDKLAKTKIIKPIFQSIN